MKRFPILLVGALVVPAALACNLEQAVAPTEVLTLPPPVATEVQAPTQPPEPSPILTEPGEPAAAPEPTEAPFTPEPSPEPATPAPPPLTSDFTPCTGESGDPPRDTDPNSIGPWNARIMTATSTDSLTWTRTNTVIADQADVPGGIVAPNGRVFLYYVTWCQEVRNRLVVAVSDDLQNWVYKLVNIEGLAQGWADPVDPSVVLLDDGQFRLYFTSGSREGGSSPSTYSALSSDGIRFTLEEGVRFQADGMVLDPNVLRAGDRWVFFAGGARPPGSNHFALSSDGLTFNAQAPFSAENVIMANGLAVPDGYRYYGFDQSGPPGTPRYIRSLFSADGVNWTVEDGNRLDPDEGTGLETNEVKDPSVVQLADGTYLMFYVTGIP